MAYWIDDGPIEMNKDILLSALFRILQWCD